MLYLLVLSYNYPHFSSWKDVLFSIEKKRLNWEVYFEGNGFEGYGRSVRAIKFSHFLLILYGLGFFFLFSLGFREF
jgi:hypothetical protein